MPVLDNARYERFCQELAQGNDVGDSYELAGFKRDKGNASRLRVKPFIQERVDEILGKAAEIAEITQADVLRELAKIGFSDIRKLFSPGGNLMPIHDLDDDTAASLSSVEVVTKRVPGGDEAEVEHVTKVKLWDKKGALVDIGKHLGMFKESPAPPSDLNVNLNIGDSDLARLIVFQLTKAAKQAE